MKMNTLVNSALLTAVLAAMSAPAMAYTVTRNFNNGAVDTHYSSYTPGVAYEHGNVYTNPQGQTWTRDVTVTPAGRTVTRTQP